MTNLSLVLVYTSVSILQRTTSDCRQNSFLSATMANENCHYRVSLCSYLQTRQIIAGVLDDP